MRFMNDEQTLYIDYILKVHQPLHKKIWNCIKYIFNRQAYFFADTILDVNKTKELIKYLQETVKEMEQSKNVE